MTAKKTPGADPRPAPARNRYAVLVWFFRVIHIHELGVDYVALWRSVVGTCAAGLTAAVRTRTCCRAGSLLGLVHRFGGVGGGLGQAIDGSLYFVNLASGEAGARFGQRLFGRPPR